MDTNRLMAHAIEAYQQGNRTLAGMAFARILRSEPANEHAWLWLSACIDQTGRQRECLERVLRINPQNHKALERLHVLDQYPAYLTNASSAHIAPPSDQLPVSLYAAGVKFDGRPVIVRALHLRQPVVLRRDPENAYDPYAIRLETTQGEQFGFVRKEATPLLAPFLDSLASPLQGVITELFSDVEGGNLRVGVVFYLPEDAIELHDALTQLQEGKPEIAYLIEHTSDATYLLIDGSEQDLRHVQLGLRSAHIDVTKYGTTFRPASDGCFYNWYLRLASQQVGEREIKACLEGRFVIRPSETAVHDAEELASLFESDRAMFEDKLNRTLNQVAFYQSEIGRLERLPGNSESNNSLSLTSLRDALRAHTADHLCPVQMLNLIQALFPDRVIVLGSALEAANEVERYRNRGRLFDLLWKLASEYPELMESGDGNRNRCEDLFGREAYASHDDDSTRVKRNSRKFKYMGEDILMNEHLKIGNAPDPLYTLRIHFTWMKDEGKVVIGHCGRHLL